MRWPKSFQQWNSWHAFKQTPFIWPFHNMSERMQRGTFQQNKECFSLQCHSCLKETPCRAETNYVTGTVPFLSSSVPWMYCITNASKKLSCCNASTRMQLFEFKHIMCTKCTQLVLSHMSHYISLGIVDSKITAGCYFLHVSKWKGKHQTRH